MPDHPPGIAGTALPGIAVLVAGALVASLAAGCRGGPPEGFVLQPLVAAHRYAVGPGVARPGAAGLRFATAPALAGVEVDHEMRPAVVTTAAGPGGLGDDWSWTGRVPRHAVLHAGLQIVPAALPYVRRLQAVALVIDGADREVLQVARWRAGADPEWLDLSADLSRYAGHRVTLVFSATLRGLPPRLRAAPLVAWAPVALTGAAPEATPAAARPNILVILVDTLRRDRLTPYGCRLETSPEIARWLAAHGTVMEDAYSQAPWTLPSVVSLMTGRYPGEVLGNDLAAYGIPPAVAPLAERLRGAGYVTAGFIGNPTLHVGAGFERGFQTLYAPPADVNWLFRHADDINRHALPWLRAQQDQGRPFFLYLHYIDPHDPYENPETVGNRSAFEGEYRGPVAGTWVNGFYSGKLALGDPARDVAHLSALYDSEVHYVDGRIGEVLAAIHPRVLGSTLVLLIADHGEELYDHGGWKHGQSLYEEQIHVPMIWRWDGRIAAGRQLAGTVRLLDVAPTLAAAAGAAPDPGWEGASLLAELTGGARLGERPAFAQAMSGGPLLAAAVAGRQKLIVYNRDEPFAPANELESYLWRHNLDRLAAVEAYDLEHDPGEHHNLASPAPAPNAQALDRLSLLAQVLDRHLDRTLPGLRLAAGGVPPGAHLRLALTLAAPPRRWAPYLLGPADHAVQDGARLTVELTGASPVVRGVRLEGVAPAAPRDGAAAGAGPVVLSLAATLDGRPLPARQLAIGAGVPWDGRPLGLAALRTASFPAVDPPPGAAGAGMVQVMLWLHDAAAPTRAHDAETERRLRALGYIE